MTYKLLEPPKMVDKTKNEVNILYPTRSRYGVWAFTDLSVGLYEEPFVGEINDMIDMFTDGRDQCIVYISHSPLPNANGHLLRLKEESDGWYELEGKGISGWLCPAVLKYFQGYPDDIYFKIEEVKL